MEQAEVNGKKFTKNITKRIVPYGQSFCFGKCLRYWKRHKELYIKTWGIGESKLNHGNTADEALENAMQTTARKAFRAVF